MAGRGAAARRAGAGATSAAPGSPPCQPGRGASRPSQALVTPLSRQGGDPYGFLVAALNRYRPLDEDYRGFVGLVAGHLAAGIASARSYRDQQRRAEELAELDRAKTTFFSNISHEFRTPLTLIMGPVQELQRLMAEADPQVREELEVISRNAQRLGRLVNTLLDFSRIEAGRMQARYEPTDMAQATAELASVFRSAIDRAGLAFEVDCPALPEPVYLDRGMWEKVVLNLLSNALKSTFDGSIRIAVSAKAATRSSGSPTPASVSPSRRCPGCSSGFTASRTPARVPMRAAASAWPWFRNSSSCTAAPSPRPAPRARAPRSPSACLWARPPASRRPRPGRHAATVSATADPFVQEALRWVPGTEEEMTARGALRRSAQHDASRHEGRAQPARVLVADDNADMREYLARLLRTAGYQVTTVTDGQAALDAVRADAPDLVISDVMMPRLSGLDLVAALRANARTAAVPVLLLSARAGQEASVEGLHAGADDYLVKPFTAVELLARLRSNLEMARFRNRESQFRRTLIDSLQEGFFVTDQEGAILEANHAFLTLVGYREDGLPFRWPHPWVPDPGTEPGQWTMVAQAFSDYKQHGGGRYTVPVLHRDGRTVWLACSSAGVPSPDGHGQLFVGTARDVTAERLAGQREATLAGFAAALAATREISEMLTTAAREIAAAVAASQVTAALWSSDDNLAVTAWPRHATGQGASVAVTGTLDAIRRQPAASVAVLPGEGDDILLAAPLDGTGASAIAAEFPAGRPVSAEARELFSVLTSHLAQVLAKARDYEQARTVASPSSTPSSPPPSCRIGFAARYTPAVPPLEVGGDWYDVIPLPGQRTAVVVGDCVGRGLPAAAVMGQLRSASQAVLLRAPVLRRHSPTWTLSRAGFRARNAPPYFARSSIPRPGRSATAAPGIRRLSSPRSPESTICSTRLSRCHWACCPLACSGSRRPPRCHRARR